MVGFLASEVGEVPAMVPWQARQEVKKRERKGDMSWEQRLEPCLVSLDAHLGCGWCSRGPCEFPHISWLQSSVSAGLSHRTRTQESWATSGTGWSQDFLPLPENNLLFARSLLQIDRPWSEEAPSLRLGGTPLWGVPRACSAALWLNVRLTGNFSSFFVSIVDLLFLEGSSPASSSW